MKSNYTQTGTATMTIDGKSFELPVLKGSCGPEVIDIRTLFKQSGDFTFDPGFTSTASTESQITFIDGAKGQLLYRGYPIEQLAEKSTFLETAYLLMNGELPNTDEFDKYRKTITNHTMLHDQIESFFHGFRRDAPPYGDDVRHGWRHVGVLS